MKVVDAEMLAFSQGVTRRGSYAAYLDMSHPEIEEFLDVRKPTEVILTVSLLIFITEWLFQISLWPL